MSMFPIESLEELTRLGLEDLKLMVENELERRERDGEEDEY